MSDKPEDSVRSPLGRALLDSAHGDAPRSGSADRALSLLLGGGAAGAGIAGATSAAAKVGASAAGAAATGASGAGVGAAVSVAGGSVALLKWIGVGVLAIGAVTATVVRQDKAIERSPQVIAVAPSGVAPPVPSPVATAAPAPATAGNPTPSRVVAPPPVVAAPPTTAKAAPVPPPASSVLAQETAELDVARARLAGGDARGALASLDAFEANRPHAVLHDEAIVLRIEALDASGDRASATALAQSFLAQRPESPYARRIRSRLDLGKP